MRVTVVELSPSGGLFHFAVQLCDGLAELGHDVELITGHDPELPPRHPGVRVLPILPTWHPGATRQEPWLVRKVRRAARALRYLEAWRRVYGRLAAHPPDVVQWAEWRFALDGWVVAALARRARSPVQADVAHTPRPFNEQATSGSLHKSGRLMTSALRSAYAAMDVVYVLGETARRDMHELWPEARRVEVIPHGDEQALLGARALRPVTASTETVLFFGTLARYKGLDVLLESWPLVRAARPEAQLVIAGAPADADIPALVRKAGALPGVDLQVGYVPVDEVAGLMERARLVVAPYVLAYGSGVVALAHTCGRPVVVSDVGDLATAVRDGVTGLVVRPEAPDDLAAAVSSLLADPQLAARLGDAGRAGVATHGSWVDVAREMAATYQLLLDRRGERTSG